MKTSLFLSMFICTILVNAQQNQEQTTYNGARGWVKSDRSFSKEQRQIGTFDAVVVGGPFEVKLIAGKEGTITLNGTSKQLEMIETKVIDNTLKIAYKNKAKLRNTYNKTVRITLPVSEINGVTLSGSGDITSEFSLKSKSFEAKLSGSGNLNLQIESDDVEAKLSGSGKLKLQGRTENLEMALAGSGHLEAKGLLSTFATAKLSGSGRVTTCALSSLNAQVSGSGTVKYCDQEGGLKVRSNVVGSGKVVSAF